MACFIGKTLRTKYYFDYINNILGGSAQPNASAQTLGGFKWLFPPKSILEDYYNIVNNYDLLKTQNFNENQHLAKTRDYILPKLISGEVSVKN